MTHSLKNASTHHWLKHRSEINFHAYLLAKRGEDAVCGEGLAIAELNEMDIPGERSPCCLKCMSALYGFTQLTLLKTK